MRQCSYLEGQCRIIEQEYIGLKGYQMKRAEPPSTILPPRAVLFKKTPCKTRNHPQRNWRWNF